MNDFISQCLTLLEVSDRRRRKIELLVQQRVSEYGLSDPSQIYTLIIGEIEKNNTPFHERFFTRLDARPSEDRRMFHELVAPVSESIDNKELIPQVKLSPEYQRLFDTLAGFLPGIDLETLVDLHLARPDVVQERLHLLQEKAEQSTYLIPPLRPVKKAYFSGDNEFHLVLGKRPKGYDPMVLYHKYYEGLSGMELISIDPGLHSTILRRGDIMVLPRKKRPKGYDPMVLYHKYYEGLSPGELVSIDKGLYQAIWLRGHLEDLPRKIRPKGYDSWQVYVTEFAGCTTQFLSIYEPSLYKRLSADGHLHKIPKAKRVQRDGILGLW